jgi:hypothetical protein
MRVLRTASDACAKHVGKGNSYWLNWLPSIPLRDGMAKTYAWIEQQNMSREKIGVT